MSQFCDNCCNPDCSVVEGALTLSTTPTLPSELGDSTGSTTRLPIGEALSSICCTLWGDPDPEIGPADPPEEQLQLCPTCLQHLTQLYNTLLQFRHLCREQGRVFGCLLELRKLRRRQKTVEAVVELKRLPTSKRRGRISKSGRQQRLKHLEGDEESDHGTSIVNKVDVEIKEEHDCGDDHLLRDNQGDWDYILDTSDVNSKSDDEEFAIRPHKSHPPEDDSDSCFNPGQDDDDDPSKSRESAPLLEFHHDCEICRKRFLHLSGKRRHIRHAHSETPIPRIPCPVEDCESTFARKDDVRKHCTKYHPTVQINLPHSPTKTEFYQCSICPQKFLHASGKSRHMRHNHGQKSLSPCPVDSCQFTCSRKDNLRKHMKSCHPTVHLERERRAPGLKRGSYNKVRKEGQTPPPKTKVRVSSTTKCPQCDKVINKRHLSDHLITHSNERPHLCEQCGKSYKTRAGLGTHIKETHSSAGDTFTCPHAPCDVTCTRIDSLKRHIAAIHQSLASIFTCDTCGKHFVHERNLRAHQKTHGTDATLECSICNKVLSRADNLRNHMKTVHEGMKVYSPKNKTGTGVRSRNTVAKVVSGKGRNGQGIQFYTEQQDDQEFHNLTGNFKCA